MRRYRRTAIIIGRLIRLCCVRCRMAWSPDPGGSSVYNVDTVQRAVDIKEMLKRDSIYRKQSANISLQANVNAIIDPNIQEVAKT